MKIFLRDWGTVLGAAACFLVPPQIRVRVTREWATSLVSNLVAATAQRHCCAACETSRGKAPSSFPQHQLLSPRHPEGVGVADVMLAAFSLVLGG